MIGQGMGVLGWPPDQFWGSTLNELHLALTGYAESRGQRKASRLPDSAYAEMIAMAEAEAELEGA